MTGPLDGFRVLDLTQGIAGPYCTKMFADYGAKVLKIERPDGGDFARRLGPFPDNEPHPERSGMFLELNTGKQSLTLNLKTASGRGILQRLAQDVDLVVENFRPGTLNRLGLSSEALWALNPRAVLLSISNFGQDGPYRDLEADDLLAYAMGGAMSVTAYLGRDPLKLGLYAPLFLVGSVAAATALGVLLGARRDGEGEHIDVSIMEVLAGSYDRAGPNLVSWEYTRGLYTKPEASSRFNALPNGVYPCSDGYIQISGSPQWWGRFCQMMDRPDLIEDADYVPHLFDPQFAPEIDAIFYPWLMEHSKLEIMAAGQRYGLPVSALSTMEDVLRDPHLEAREFFATIEHPEAGEWRYPGLPSRLSDTPGELRRAPLLGEHTSTILRERLGYTPEEVVILRQRNVI